MKAAVLWERRTPLKIEDLTQADPEAGEVRVKLAASGVCHSDLSHMTRDTWSVPPMVMGHEGAGVVAEVGPGVTRVKPGDHVIIAFGSRCGECFFCLRGEPYLCTPAAQPPRIKLRKGDVAINPFTGVGTFAEYTLVDQRNLVVIPDDMPLDRASLIACGVTTGIGAVINTAKVEPGASVAVIGAGGVGLNVVQGARLAGAARIIAVDVRDNKLEMARTFGATHGVNASREDPIEAVRKLTGGYGADYAFEVIGHPKTIEQAYEMVRKGGTAVVVGVAEETAQLSLSAVSFMRTGKTLMGCNYGSVRPQVDFPRFVDLYMNGRIMLDELISRRFTLDEVNQAFEAMEAGEVARGVIMYE